MSSNSRHKVRNGTGAAYRQSRSFPPHYCEGRPYECRSAWATAVDVLAPGDQGAVQVDVVSLLVRRGVPTVNELTVLAVDLIQLRSGISRDGDASLEPVVDVAFQTRR
jgi:hypothetical protein